MTARLRLLLACSFVLACDSGSTPAESDATAKAPAKSEADAKAKPAEKKAEPKPEPEPAPTTAAPPEVAPAVAEVVGYVPEKAAGATPEIESSWVEIDQGGIYVRNAPAISTDGKMIVHQHQILGGGEQLVFRTRAGEVTETIELLTPDELVKVESVPELEKLLAPRIEAGKAALAKRSWIPLTGGMITPDQMKKSGLEANVDGDRLVVKRDGAEVFADAVAKREPCEKPYVHGLWRDPDNKLAYVLVAHSVDECKPEKPDEHHMLPLK